VWGAELYYPEVARLTTSASTSAAETRTADAPEMVRLRRQLSHDIHHELSTIMLLASMLSTAPDVGADSRNRARQILGETRWLDQLHRAYDNSLGADGTTAPMAEPVRLDLLGAEVVGAMQLSTFVQISFTGTPVWARVDRLAFWRALRNLVGNAVRAAGPEGEVETRVEAEDGWAVVHVDDNGPGFGAVPPGTASLGLGIVQDLAAAWGGELEIRRGVLGGCGVTLRLPVSPPPAEGTV
jgi:signal transduction histidine kinase